MHQHSRAVALLLMTLAFTGCAAEEAEDTGATESAIINGTETKGFPAVGHLVINDTYNCTGTLIAPQIVLTATHCVYFEAGAVRFETAGQSVVADKWSWHGGYAGGPENTRVGNAGNVDIALVHLSAPIRGVTPIPLTGNLPKKGTAVTLVGFGQAYAGEGRFDVKRAGPSKIGVVSNDWFFIDGKSWTCHGDSGGPAFVTERGGLRLIGVFSRLKNDCSGGSSYMTAPLFADWIAATSKGF